MPPKRSLSAPVQTGSRPQPQPQPQSEPDPEPQPGFGLRVIRSASEARLRTLAGGAEVGEVLECCICFSEWSGRGDQPPAPGLSCGNEHFTCRDCLASYIESEMSPARLAKNSGRVGCAACYESVGAIATETGDGVDAHAAFSEKQLRDTLRASDALSAYERGQQRLVERLLLDDSLVCPSCGYFELVDRPEVATEYRVRGRVWACAGCGARSCHRCLPAMEMPKDGTEHRCRRSVSDSGGESGGGHSEQQLYHRLTEVLTKGRVGYCPRGCPTPLVKDQGCNCMQCVQPGCGIYFCFLCNADLGDDSGEAHRSHFRANACWMFDGGEKTLEVAHAHRTHALVYSLVSALSEDARRTMLAAPSCAAELKAVGFNYDSFSAQTNADGVAEQPSITADAVANIERLASVQAARLARGGISAPLVPPRARPQQQRRPRPLNRRDVRRISIQTMLAFLHHHVLLLLMAGHLWTTRATVWTLLSDASTGNNAMVPRLKASAGILRSSKLWMWLLAGYAQAAAQVMGFLFRGGATCLGFAGAFLLDHNILDRNIGLCMIVGGAGYGVGQFLLNLVPTALKSRPAGSAAAATKGYASLRHAIRSDSRTVMAFGATVLLANVVWPVRQRMRRRRTPQ